MAATIKYDQAGQDNLATLAAPSDARNVARQTGRQATASGTITLDNSYATGGYAVTPSNFGLWKVAGVLFEDVNGYAFYFNKTTGKVQVFTSGGTEVAAATNLSTLPAVYFEAKGLV